MSNSLRPHELQHTRPPCPSLTLRVYPNTCPLSQWCHLSTSFSVHSVQFSTVQFSSSVVSDSLRPHESQHTGPLCPSPTPGVHSNSCPLSRWCHPAISSVVSFSSCPQFLPASEFFLMSQLFAGGGQSIGVSALASFLPKNTQDWSPFCHYSGIICISEVIDISPGNLDSVLIHPAQHFA